MGKYKEKKLREGHSLSTLGMMLIVAAGLLAWHLPDNATSIEVAGVLGVLGAILCLAGNHD